MLSILVISIAIPKQNVSQTKHFKNSFLQFQPIAECLYLDVP